MELANVALVVLERVGMVAGPYWHCASRRVGQQRRRMLLLVVYQEIWMRPIGQQSVLVGVIMMTRVLVLLYGPHLSEQRGCLLLTSQSCHALSPLRELNQSPYLFDVILHDPDDSTCWPRRLRLQQKGAYLHSERNETVGRRRMPPAERKHFGRPGKSTAGSRRSRHSWKQIPLQRPKTRFFFW